MKVIRNLDNSNLGGVYSVMAIPFSSLSVFAVVLNRVNMVYNDENCIEIGCVDGSVEFGGSVADGIKISGISSRIGKDSLPIFSELAAGYWLVLFEDNNGDKRVAGDLKTQLGFKFSSSTGKIGEMNSVSWEFFGDTMEEPYFLA